MKHSEQHPRGAPFPAWAIRRPRRLAPPGAARPVLSAVWPAGVSPSAAPTGSACVRRSPAAHRWDWLPTFTPWQGQLRLPGCPCPCRPILARARLGRTRHFSLERPLPRSERNYPHCATASWSWEAPTTSSKQGGGSPSC